MRAEIMIVDDDTTLRPLLGKLLTATGYGVREADSLKGLRACLEQPAWEPDVLLLDLQLGDGYGLSVLPEVKQHWPGTRVVILTGHGSVEAAEQAYKMDNVFLLNKPMDAAMLTTVIELALSDKPHQGFRVGC
jgi:DNA-binding NtrC family response regulator